MVILTFLLLSVFFAIYCMALIFVHLSHFTSKLWLNRCLLIALMFLNGLGIFIGRFLRFHTVHLITRPFTIITEVISALNDSSLIFISLMMLLNLSFYYSLKG